MGFSCGIVGLPNVGKSTLFNALTETAAAEAANFPFCTIEPNVGKVAVPDQRLQQISMIAKSEKTIPTQIEFVDIAGLVKGASKGEGLGNQFLANIREVDAIVHVVRCFEDENVTHVGKEINPINDLEVVEMELMLSDLASIERRLTTLQKKVRGNSSSAKQLLALTNKVFETLQEGETARKMNLMDSEKQLFKTLQLLTAKPVLYVCNVEEEAAANGNKLSRLVEDFATHNGAKSILISAKIEEEVANLPNNSEKAEYLQAIGLEEAGLSKVIQAGYKLLDLITFFTAGPNESRAWTLPIGTQSPQAAGVIHSDFERGFIKAETISFDDFVKFKGEQGAKEAGKMRQEGKGYTVVDGDVILFKFNV